MGRTDRYWGVLVNYAYLTTLSFVQLYIHTIRMLCFIQQYTSYFKDRAWHTLRLIWMRFFRTMAIGSEKWSGGRGRGKSIIKSQRRYIALLYNCSIPTSPFSACASRMLFFDSTDTPTNLFSSSPFLAEQFAGPKNARSRRQCGIYSYTGILTWVIVSKCQFFILTNHQVVIVLIPWKNGEYYMHMHW